MTVSESPFTGWALVEILGHRSVAGHVSEEQVAGAGMLRVEVWRPGDREPVACSYYSPSSIYAIHPCTEELARAAAERRATVPTPLFSLAAPPPRVALPPPESEVVMCACGHGHASGEDGEDAGCRALGCQCDGFKEFLPIEDDVTYRRLRESLTVAEPEYVPAHLRPDPADAICECHHTRGEHAEDYGPCEVTDCSCAGFREDLPF